MEDNLLTILARRWGRQKTEEKPSRSRERKHFSGRAFSIGIVVSGSKNPQATAQGENLSRLLTKSGRGDVVSLIAIRSSSMSSSGALKRILGSLHNLIDTIRRVELIHLIIDNYRGWWLTALPVTVIGRFYRKQIVIESIGNWTAHIGWLPLRLMKIWTGLCQMILVPAGQSKIWSIAPGVGVEESVPMVNLESMTGRKLSSVQPSILADCRFLSKEMTGEIIAGCDIVKKKYPRTALTILVDSQTQRIDSTHYSGLTKSGIVVKVIEADFRIEELANSSEIFISCRTEPFVDRDILMAAASGSLIFTGKSSALTKYLRRDCHFEPTTFSGRSDLADRILELIENPDQVGDLSRQARGLAERFAWDNLSPMWLDRYERIMSD